MHPFFVYFRLFYAISVRIAFRFAFFLKKRTHNRYNPRGSILISVLIYNVSIIRSITYSIEARTAVMLFEIINRLCY